MDYEAAIEMQRICTGETRVLSRGQIAGEVIDIKTVTKHFRPAKAEKCEAFYNEMIRDDTRKEYDIDVLLEETESIKAEFEQFLKSIAGDDLFQKLFDDISEFFMTPPFEGMDGIEYGVNEVCVFSLLEYFMGRMSENHDHEQCRADYRNSIEERTYPEVADHWIGVYDSLQKRYETIGKDFTGERALEEKLAACCIVAIAAIRDQDAFALDMAQAGAEEKGRIIAQDYLDGTYQEGESAFTDNTVRLFEFAYGEIRGGEA